MFFSDSPCGVVSAVDRGCDGGGGSDGGGSGCVSGGGGANDFNAKM